MAALIRTLTMLRNENNNPDGSYQHHYHHLLPRQGPPHYYEPLDSSTKAGFIAMGICGLISFIATLSLFLFLTYRFIFWSRYYKRPLVQNQYVVLIYNLLLADLQQATAFLMCLNWVAKGGVYYPSAACVLQGWWIQIADPGSGMFIIAIAMHTCAVVLRGRQLPYWAFVACIVGLWMFILVLGFIPVGLYGSQTFVISEAGWCWISPVHEAERLWGHYIWIFLAEFGTLVLYGLMFFYLRGRMVQATKLRTGAGGGGHHNDESLHRLNRVIIYMVIYPFAYVLLSLPLAAGRMSSARHIVPSRAYFAVAGSLMALSGFVDAVVYTATRRQLLLDTEVSNSNSNGASGGRFGGYSDPISRSYHTQITSMNASVNGERDGKRGGGGVGSRIRKGMQTLTETVLDDSDDDYDNGSTEQIVKGSRRSGDDRDVEMMNMGSGGYTGHGVYQETTIEITHETVDSHEPRSPVRRSG
ncbi:G protein-coupled glucose receptor regulating Gpa2-domain-containing protein [Aspergillus pseudoustus]|uniref:G protein-coupled glucose receptor regulating Gpa2-domain-containing protein n=1 Tax=Aspergillus pseudoustus TaxID=1810923 RepID=A0ABR4J0H6_9EURO